MVADLDPDVVDVVTRVLQRSGYRVLPACDGPQALNHACQPDVDLVVLDAQLPPLDGKPLVEHIRHARPFARVLLSSGSGDWGLPAACAENKNLRLMAKPFHPDQLLQQVRTLLGTPSAGTRPPVT